MSSPIAQPCKKSYAYLLLALILFLTMVLRMFFVHEPLDRDEGTYILLGQEVFRGAVPYRDAIEMKLPGSFYLFALITMFGNSVEYIRIVTAFYSLLTVIFTYLLACTVGGRRAGLFAALLCGVFTSGPVVQGNGSNLEVFLLLPIVAGLYLLFCGFDSNKRLYFTAGGLLLACAVFIKTVALPVYLLPLFFLPFAHSNSSRWRSVALNLALYVTPGVMLCILLAAYLAVNSAWDDFVYWNFTFAKAYVETSWPIFWSRLTSRGLSTASEFTVLWIIAVPALYWFLVVRRSFKGFFLVGLVVATVIAVCMPGKFWPHYLIPLIPPLSIVAGVGLAALFENRRSLFYASLPFLVFAIYPTVKMDYPYYMASPEKASVLKYGSDVFVRAAEVARYVKERTTPEDTIFQWGWEPEIYVTADRRPPNRFLNHTLIDASPVISAAMNDFKTSILFKRPKYVIVQSGREKWPGFQELSAIATTYYHIEAAFGGYTIYRSNVL